MCIKIDINIRLGAVRDRKGDSDSERLRVNLDWTARYYVSELILMIMIVAHVRLSEMSASTSSKLWEQYVRSSRRLFRE